MDSGLLIVCNESESAPYFCSCGKRRTSGGLKNSGEGSRTPLQIRESGGGDLNLQNSYWAESGEVTETEFSDAFTAQPTK